MGDTRRLHKLMADLTGEAAPIPDGEVGGAVDLLDNGRGLGLSQLNEVLLLLGYDRVSSSFFQYLVDRTTDYYAGSSMASFEQLEAGVVDFQKLALLIYGNVKFTFKTLSRDPDLLSGWLAGFEPVHAEMFENRHLPVLPIRQVSPEKTYLLGYLVEQEVKERLSSNPDDPEALAMEHERKAAVSDGLVNHNAYLASDHLDVYVATSMRERHEYLMVSRVARSIFGHEELRRLNLRWFDPTQAYCPDRIDKGLAEALMLKRAKCTIYLAQETETLGKDSELASTLAQGKPVVAYIPRGDRAYVDGLLDDLRTVYSRVSEPRLILEQLRVFAPRAAWDDLEVRRWLDDPEQACVEALRSRLYSEVSRYYEKRARMLKDLHPLGIQVVLSSGVANGVLVVRSVEDCARLVQRIVTRTMEFDLEEYLTDGKRYIVLREKISGSIFRVVTGDEMLTNAFWNLYLLPEA